MEIREGQGFDEPRAGRVVLIRLAREACHDVRANAAVGDLRANGQDAFGILRCPVTPVHQPENSVTPALQWNVEMSRQTRLSSDELDQFRANIHRLHGADPNSGNRGFRQYALDQA
jgi:hypothetical protein